MRRHHPENETIKREYFAFLRNAKGRDEATLDAVAAAIHDFEAANGYASFKTFGRAKAISYKARLGDQRNPKTGKPLSRATLHSRLGALKTFFEWLSQQQGYKRAVIYTDAAYFSLTANDARVATARREQRTPSLAQIVHVLEIMPGDTLIARRDRAVVAFIILTGARDGAVASMCIKHVRLANGAVDQDPREVKTKRAKTFTSSFFPVGDFPKRVVTDWIEELKSDLLFGPDDPIFPAGRIELDDAGAFHTAGLSRTGWKDAAAIRTIFRKAFEAAGFDYYPPHSFRRTLMQLAYDLELTPRQMKAWSQSLGHDSVLTSLTSYGQVSVDEQSRVMTALAQRGPAAAPRSVKVLELLAALGSELGADQP